jgi:hypothetical protein
MTFLALGLRGVPSFTDMISGSLAVKWQVEYHPLRKRWNRLREYLPCG